MSWTADDIPEQDGQTIVITGANSGIGLEATRELARNGATVIMACRSTERGEDAANGVRGEIPDADLRVEECNLGDLESVRSFAAGLEDEAIDVLINNAGVMAIPRSETADGFETQFGVNHLGHFALTGLLLESQRPTARSPRGSSASRAGSTRAARSTSTIFSTRSPTTSGRPTPSRSWRTSCSRTNSSVDSSPRI